MIKLYNFDELKPEEILNRDIRAEKNVEDVVDAIIADVRARGDDALKDYALKFDGAEIEILQVTQAEMNRLVAQEAARYQGQEREVQKYFAENAVVLRRGGRLLDLHRPEAHRRGDQGGGAAADPQPSLGGGGPGGGFPLHLRASLLHRPGVPHGVLLPLLGPGGGPPGDPEHGGGLPG